MSSRTMQVGTKAYTPEVMALFGAICVLMSQHGYVLSSGGGLLERVALEQLEKNLELEPNDARLHDPELVSGQIHRFARTNGAVDGIPMGLHDVFAAFVKKAH